MICVPVAPITPVLVVLAGVLVVAGGVSTVD
jgi:hypothetical protein